MVGLWNQKGIPHKDWICLGVEDLEDERIICEMCRGREIRYAHTMEHPEYSGKLMVGSECAKNMEDDKIAPKEREHKLINKVNWLKKHWSVAANAKDFHYYRNIKGLKMRIYKNNKGWKVWVLKNETGQSWSSPDYYSNIDDAKLTAYAKYLELKD